MMEFVCTIPLKPESWARNRTGGGNHFRPKSNTGWKRAAAMLLRSAARQACWSPGAKATAPPVRVDVVFVFARTKRRPSRVPADVWATGARVARPTGSGSDLDRLLGLVYDAIDDAGIVWDDGQIAHGLQSKWWAAKGCDACVEVRVSEASWLAETDEEVM